MSRTEEKLDEVEQDSVLLEREGDLGTLERMVGAACRGAGQLVVVEGPAGIGKTCLLEAAGVQAHHAGMRVLVARGLPLEQDFAYGVVRQLFEPILACAGQAEQDELFAGAAAQAAVLFDSVDAAAGGEDISFALLHGLFWLTANLAQRPLMMVIDDLHWADGPSMRFLAYLLPRLEGLPLLVSVGLRPAESTIESLQAHITTDPVVTTLRPAPLSEEASAQLVRSVLRGKVEDPFCRACHTVTGGNPLLLRELIDAAAVEGLEATAAGIVRLYEIGTHAVKLRVALRLARLGSAAVAFCDALAILGDGVDPVHVAQLAGLEPPLGLRTSRQLIGLDILHQSRFTSGSLSAGKISFVHPLVRAAVYEAMADTARLDGHIRAARLLAAGGEAPERVAAHVLLIPPTGDGFVVTALRRAADQAFARGSPDSAVSYLERCLQEPPNKERADVLFQLGVAAQLIDAAKSADYLAAAMEAAEDLKRKVIIAELLGTTLFMAGRSGEAANVISRGIEILSTEDTESRRRLQALLVHASVIDTGQWRFATENVSKLRGVPSGAGVGSRMLDVTVAFHDLLIGAGLETPVMLARRGLGDGMLIEQVNQLSHYGCYVLIVADLQDDALPLLDTYIAAAYRCGSMFALAPAKCVRGLAWLSRGALVEAEENLRDSFWVVRATAQQVGGPIVAAYLADSLMEQGKLDEAEEILTAAGKPEPPRAGYWAWWLGSRARLLMLRGRIQEGLQTWLACGSRFAAHGGQNPAVLPWRSGAALALYRLGRGEEAQELAAQEIILARRWGAPTALGRALRVAGLIRGGQDGLALLQESTTVLASSPARLEYAKALVDLGAALRRVGRRAESRQQLRLGVELAQICGATPLVELGLTELRVSGARRPHIAPSGPDALTPSERRVAELAAAGYTNRDIAQMLFITTNTVEVHLTRTYRKLGVKGRAHLAGFPFPRPGEQQAVAIAGGD